VLNSPGRLTSITWEDAEKQAHYAKFMAKCIAAAPANGFTVEQVTQGQIYPVAEVEKYLPTVSSDTETGISEDAAISQVAESVDTSIVLRLGEGQKIVYAYGYGCAPDRLKIGLTEGDAVQRIAAQISTGTPDRPILLLEIRTHDCSALERAIHAILEYRGRKISGAGKEWFKATRDEIISIYESVKKPHP